MLRKKTTMRPARPAEHNKGEGRRASSSYDSLVSRITPVQHIEQPLKAALYGRSGSGKTTLAASFPGPALLLDVKDRGTDSVSDVKDLRVVEINEWVDFEQAYWYLKSGKAPYKTVIIDTVSQLQEIAIAHVLAEQRKDVENAGNWGTLTKRDWGSVAALLKTWLTNYRDLEINVVFIAQDRVFNVGEEEVEGADGAILPEVGPRVMPSVAATLNAAVNLVGNTFIRENVERIKDPKTKKTREVRRTEYCLRIGPHTYYMTKVRKPRSITPPAFIVNPTYQRIKELFDGKKAR